VCVCVCATDVCAWLLNVTWLTITWSALPVAAEDQQISGRPSRAGSVLISRSWAVGRIKAVSSASVYCSITALRFRDGFDIGNAWVKMQDVTLTNLRVQVNDPNRESHFRRRPGDAENAGVENEALNGYGKPLPNLKSTKRRNRNAWIGRIAVLWTVWTLRLLLSSLKSHNASRK